MVKQPTALLCTCVLLAILPTRRAHPTLISTTSLDNLRPTQPHPTPGQARALAQQYAHRLTHAQEYLQRFGFLAEDDDGEDLQRIQDAIVRFQESSGIPESGLLDDSTFEEMSKPRCGSVIIHKRRLRRFATAQTSRWEKLTPDNVLRLKWFISRYTKDMTREEIKTIVRKSFALWSSQTAINSMPSVTLHFEEAARESDADITILWAEGDHGDAYKFDGTGNHTNILAHTFYPTYQETGTLNGDIHLDDSEKWSGEGSGTAFSNVFVHEIGHALGLGHSKRQDAIMFPIYKKEVLEHVSLDLDDKCALNWNYIGPTKLCLFVWLMAEVLPRQIEQKNENLYEDNLLVSSMSKTKQGVTAKVNKLKKKLRDATIPQCKEDNDVKERFEGLLQDKLDFPYSNAHQYSSVVCNFLDGLVKYRREQEERPEENKGTADDELKMEEIANHFLQEYMSPMEREPRRHRRRLSHRHRHTHSSLFDRRFFDFRFFDRFFTVLGQ